MEDDVGSVSAVLRIGLVIVQKLSRIVFSDNSRIGPSQGNDSIVTWIKEFSSVSISVIRL